MTDQSPASWFSILAVLVAELVLAASAAFIVAQGYLSYECSDAEFAALNTETCAHGFPYPLY